MDQPRPVRFAALGLDHAHALGQIGGLLAAGAELVGLQSATPDAAVTQSVRQAWPHAAWYDDPQPLLADPSVDLIVTAAVPGDRAGISIAALRAGKDVVSDKPGCLSLAELADIEAAVAASGRFWSVTFSERFEVPCVARAGALIQSGRIGEVVHILSSGPHREGDRAHLAGGVGRPEWFYDPVRNGGVLADIASHQIDQYLWLTGASTAEISHAAVGNFAHPEIPEFQDFGELILKTPTTQGFIQVHWFTPQGLPTWGDGRVVITGTRGSIELRKYVDIAGRPGGNHLFVVDDQGIEYLDCSNDPITYYANILADVRNRTESATPQAHTYEVVRLALTAQAHAERRGHLSPA